MFSFIIFLRRTHFVKYSILFIDILKDSIKSYSFDKNSEWQSLATFECRGIEPVDFDPRVNFVIKLPGSC